MSDQNTTDVTETLPTMDDKTRKNTKKFVGYGIAAAAALLLVDDQVKKFKNRKSVKVVVEDKDA